MRTRVIRVVLLWSAYLCTAILLAGLVSHPIINQAQISFTAEDHHSRSVAIVIEDGQHERIVTRPASDRVFRLRINVGLSRRQQSCSFNA